MTNSTDGARVVVIGAGPGGYAAAFHAADLGMDVTLVDVEAEPGGVCLYRGCIPSKALLHVASLLRETRDAEAWGVHFGAPEIDLDALGDDLGGAEGALEGAGVEGLDRHLSEPLRELRGLTQAAIAEGHVEVALNASLGVRRGLAMADEMQTHAAFYGRAVVGERLPAAAAARVLAAEDAGVGLERRPGEPEVVGVDD